MSENSKILAIKRQREDVYSKALRLYRQNGNHTNADLLFNSFIWPVLKQRVDEYSFTVTVADLWDDYVLEVYKEPTGGIPRFMKFLICKAADVDKTATLEDGFFLIQGRERQGEWGDFLITHSPVGTNEGMLLAFLARLLIWGNAGGELHVNL